jgi:chaperone protein EcpD
VFWLNVLEVPPKPSSLVTQNANTLQMAIRSRLKLFYRPAGLAGDPVKAPGELTFKANGNAIVVHNPTPYYVTITDLHVIVGGASHKADAGMVAPMSDLSLPVSDLKQAPAAGSAVEFHCINDYGSDVTLKGTVAA